MGSWRTWRLWTLLQNSGGGLWVATGLTFRCGIIPRRPASWLRRIQRWHVVQLDENKYKLLFLGCGSRQDRGTGNSQRGDESLCVSRIRTGRFVSWFDNMPRLVAIFVKTIKRISTVRIVWTQSFFWLALGHWIVAHVLHNGQEANACSNHSIQVARAKPE